MNTTQTQTSSAWKRRFFTIWSGQAFSLLGSSLAGFALVWWLTITSGSATVLAIGTLMQVLPQIFLGPLMGALVDRWNRRIVMIVADGLIALFSFGLAVLFVLGKAVFWHVYVILFVRAVGGVFHLLAMQASTPLMVPEKQLGRVAGINQTLQGMMSIAAPALGAVLLGLIPIQGVLMIDVGTAALAILPLLFILIPQPVRNVDQASIKINEENSVPAQAGTSLGREIREGLRYVWNWPGLRALMVMVTIANLFGIPAMSFIPLLVTRHFGLGVLQVGWMGSVEGIGVLCGGLLLTIWGGFRQRIVTILLGAILEGIGLLVMGLAPVDAFLVALAGNLLWTLMRPILDGVVFAIVQTVVPPDLQGRVFSIMLSGAGASSLLGLGLAGPIVDHTGVSFWFVLTGVVVVLIGAAGFLIPAVMRLEQGKPDIPSEKSFLKETEIHTTTI
jgi:MFS transporter, DHA3 family, macrolide efflux protein